MVYALTVYSAHLPSKPKGSLLEPSVYIEISTSGPGSSSDKKLFTSICERTYKPSWKENFRLPIAHERDCTISLEFKHHNSIPFKADSTLGRIQIQAQDLLKLCEDREATEIEIDPVSPTTQQKDPGSYSELKRIGSVIVSFRETDAQLQFSRAAKPVKKQIITYAAATSQIRTGNPIAGTGLGQNLISAVSAISSG